MSKWNQFLVEKKMKWKLYIIQRNQWENQKEKSKKKKERNHFVNSFINY